MPIYKLKIGDTDAGKLQVANPNNVVTWSYKGPNDTGYSQLNPAPTVNAGSNPMNPAVNDTLNISACTAISGAPANSASYAAAAGSKKAGYYYVGQPEPGGSAPGSWDAEDTGGGK
jgi:hypothetical protein